MLTTSDSIVGRSLELEGDINRDSFGGMIGTDQDLMDQVSSYV